MSDARDDAPGTSLLFDVFALGHAVNRLLATTMQGGPLTPAEYAVYSAIFELEAASPTQLAGRLGMRLTTFMDQLRLVERRGHASRIGHPTDRRSYRVVLTAAGREAHREANGRFERAYREFSARLPDGESAAQAAVRAVRDAADAAAADLSGGAAEPAAGAPRVLASPRRRGGRGG